MWKDGEEIAAFFILIRLTDHCLSVLWVYTTVKNKNSISKVKYLSNSTEKSYNRNEEGKKDESKK